MGWCARAAAWPHCTPPPAGREVRAYADKQERLAATQEGGAASRPFLAGLFGGRLDHRATHVVAAVGANHVRGDRRATLPAVLQLERFDGVMRPATTGAGIRTFSFWDSHGNQPNARPDGAGPSSMRITSYKNGEWVIVREGPAECQAGDSGGSGFPERALSVKRRQAGFWTYLLRNSYSLLLCNPQRVYGGSSPV